MTTPLTIAIDPNAAAAYLQAYAAIVGALAQDRSKRARLAGHYIAADKALRYVLAGGYVEALGHGNYRFPSQSKHRDAPWTASDDGCECPGFCFGAGYCWHVYAAKLLWPYDRELARAAERMAQQQAPRRASWVCEGQHLTDDPQGAVYESVTYRAPEVVDVAPNRGVVSKAEAQADVDDLFVQKG